LWPSGVEGFFGPGVLLPLFEATGDGFGVLAPPAGAGPGLASSNAANDGTEKDLFAATSLQ
jgi:hypothetical protein